MRVLVLGGSIFLGRHVVEAALSRNHEVTLFNRGRDNPDLYPETEKLRGDRNENLSALSARSWDVVIDTSGQLPRQVRESAQLLADSVEHYTYVSSISAYADFSRPIDESMPLAVLADPTTEDTKDENYGGHKALCEQAANQSMPGRTLVIRPGLIVGPYDPTDRFTYWPHRVAEGSEILAPGPPEASVQFIDARDLAAWMLEMAERRQAGTYNATGPATPLSMGELLDVCQRVSESDARFTWANEQFLNQQGVSAWTDLPLWVPPSDLSFASFLAVNCHKAIAAGLVFRPLEQTVRDTLTWEIKRPADYQWQAGLRRPRELALLDVWHKLSAKQSS
ncbi:MAG: SDR family oxidoreductase [Ktedonobacterales bacterium]